MTITNFVSVSGGKDSTAAYLLALEQGKEFRAVFADVENEHPLVYEAVHTLAARTGGPEVETVKADFSDRFTRRRDFISKKWTMQGVDAATIARAISLMQPSGNVFLDLCMLKGRFPSAKARFCTEELKIGPLNALIAPALANAGARVFSWQGVRADESLARSLLTELQELETVGPFWPVYAREGKKKQPWPGKIFAYRPLLKWTVTDVFAIHDRHGLKRNPLYDMGMDRVGCMPCIMASKGELRKIARQFPEHIDRIAEWERIVSDVSKRGSATFFAACDDPLWDRNADKITSETHGIRQRVEWSRTSRGGRQYNLETAFEFATACNQWGVCE